MESKDIQTLAKNLINYSTNLKKGEKVLIEGTPYCLELILELIKETYKVGAYPFVNFGESKITRELLKSTNEEHIKLMANYMRPKMEDMDAYIGISATENIFELL